MTRLREHDWQDSFTSSQNNLLLGFYQPVLQQAIRYWRASARGGCRGQGGLQNYEPGTARRLKNVPGCWSDFALACLIHVGM
jgi:hypothetical protein